LFAAAVFFLRRKSMRKNSALVALMAAVSLLSAVSFAAPKPRNSVKWGTGSKGRWGVLVRKATVSNRNIRVQFPNGENPLLEVPMKAVVREDGRKVSIHDLHNGERVHVWARRAKPTNAMQAYRIYAYTDKTPRAKR
jgi:hypothetical protein